MEEIEKYAPEKLQKVRILKISNGNKSKFYFYFICFKIFIPIFL